MNKPGAASPPNFVLVSLWDPKALSVFGSDKESALHQGVNTLGRWSPYLVEGVEGRLGCCECWLCFGQVLLTAFLLLLHLQHDEGHLPLLLIRDGFLFAHLASLDTYHLNLSASSFFCFSSTSWVASLAFRSSTCSREATGLLRVEGLGTRSWGSDPAEQSANS